MKKEKIKKLEKIARQIRIDVLKMIYDAKSGHLGSSFSTIEVLTALYSGRLLEFNSGKPDWENRDYFLLSNGHACPTLYTVLAYNGFFSVNKLKYLRKIDSGLEGHPKKGSLPGIEISSGSLGMGLSQGIGIALGLRLDKKKNAESPEYSRRAESPEYSRRKVIVMMSDGEQQEGSTWEAVMAASHFKLDNLTAIIDRNQVQIGGFTEEQMALEPLAKKYLSFNWQVIEINGHDFMQIFTAFRESFENKKPTLIVSNTKGCKGVSFIEGKANTHHPKIDKDFYKKALKELQAK